MLQAVGCDPLPLCLSTLSNGTPLMRSTWALTDEDVVLLKKSKKIELLLYTDQHPPVALSILPEQAVSARTSARPQ